MVPVELPVLKSLFDVLPSGVVLMNRDTEVLFYNRYEEQLSGRDRLDVVGKRFFEQVAPCTQVAGLAELYGEQFESGQMNHTLDFRFPQPYVDRPRDVRLVLTSLEHATDRYGLLFVEDVSRIRAIERTKDFLVRMLAHDMNSPLTAAMSATELARQDEQTGTSVGRNLDTTMHSLERLRDMVVNLHEITRLHTSDVPLTLTPIDVRQLAHEAVDAVSATARLKGATIEVRADGTVEAELDHDLVRRAIVNMLDNAIRFSGKGGRIAVGVERRGDLCAIEVRDSGPGVPEELRDKIFRPFVRSGDAFVEQSHHRGLGLAFVDLVAREHGGHISLHCPAEGGSVFTLELPFERP